MKQTTLVIEIVLQDGTPMILVRDPRNGLVVKVVGSVLELTSFVQDVVDRLESTSKDGSKLS